MSTKINLDSLFIDTTILEGTVRKRPTDTDYAQYARGSNIIVSKLPSGQYGLFFQIYDFSDVTAPGEAPNYNTQKAPINPASTDTKFKAYARLDPAQLNISQQDLEAFKNMGSSQRAALLAKIPEKTDGLKPGQLMAESSGRPVLRMGYGGWGGPGDPGGSDAVYTLNARGISYQIKHTIPTVREAARIMSSLTGGKPYDVEAISHSTGAPHTSVLAALKGANQVGRHMPGAMEMTLREHEPVGGAGASSVIAAEFGKILYPNLGEGGNKKVVEDIQRNLLAVVSRSDPNSAPDGGQATLLREYRPRFHVDGSRISAGEVVCVLSDSGGRTWRINDLDPSGKASFAAGIISNVKGFITGFRPHLSRKMAEPIQNPTQSKVFNRSDNPQMCREEPLAPEKLTRLATEPSAQTSQEKRWDAMLTPIHPAVTTPVNNSAMNKAKINEILLQGGGVGGPVGTVMTTNIKRALPNDRPTPFADIAAQLGRSDRALEIAVRDSLMIRAYGNNQDPKLYSNKNNPVFEATLKTLDDGAVVLSVTDKNSSALGKKMLDDILKADKRMHDAGVHRTDGGITIATGSLDKLSEFLDKYIVNGIMLTADFLKSAAPAAPGAPARGLLPQP